MEKTNLLCHPKIFSSITCLGGLYYGFFLGEFYQTLTYPSNWHFEQNFANINYALFNSLYNFGSFIGTLVSGYSTFKLGRVKTIFYIDIITIFSLILAISSNYFEPFFIGRFFLGFSTGINFPTMLILIREFVFDKDYLKCIVLFQFSNTIGILLSNLICLYDNWKFVMGVSIIFPFLRSIYYYFKLVNKKIDTPLFMINTNPQECLQNLEKIYAENQVQTIIHTIQDQKTLLKNDFVLGDMFHAKYVAKIMFCLSILFLNQCSGIDRILGNSGLYFQKTSKINIPILFSFANFIGGLSLLYTVPAHNKKGFLKYIVGSSLSKEFIKFLTGTLIIMIILVVFGFIIQYENNDDCIVFIVLGCFYLLIYQQCVACYPYIYIPVLLPDIGVFMVLIIHSTFGIITSLSFYFGSDAFVVYRLCFTLSIIGILVAVWLFTQFIQNIKLGVDQESEFFEGISRISFVDENNSVYELNKTV